MPRGRRFALWPVQAMPVSRVPPVTALCGEGQGPGHAPRTVVDASYRVKRIAHGIQDRNVGI